MSETTQQDDLPIVFKMSTFNLPKANYALLKLAQDAEALENTGLWPGMARVRQTLLRLRKELNAAVEGEINASLQQTLEDLEAAEEEMGLDKGHDLARAA